jgi:hypothetical protein
MAVVSPNDNRESMPVGLSSCDFATSIRSNLTREETGTRLGLQGR